MNRQSDYEVQQQGLYAMLSSVASSQVERVTAQLNHTGLGDDHLALGGVQGRELAGGYQPVHAGH